MSPIFISMIWEFSYYIEPRFKTECILIRCPGQANYYCVTLEEFVWSIYGNGPFPRHPGILTCGRTENRPGYEIGKLDPLYLLDIFGRIRPKEKWYRKLYRKIRNFFLREK